MINSIFNSMQYQKLFRTFSSIIQIRKCRNFSTANKNFFKVAIIGACGGIGQPMSLLMKLSPLVTQLNLYAIADQAAGVSKDLRHIETNCRVCPYQGEDELEYAVKDVDMVVICAGVARKPGMSREDLFKVNAGIISNIADCCSKCSPKAMFCIITNPVNSTLPIAAEVYKKNNVYDPCRMFGITSLDVTRANYYVAKEKGLDPACVNVPVIGGHSDVTIVPVLSHTKPKICITEENIEKITKQIQTAGTAVVKAKAGKGSATLSMAYAGARFTISLMKAMKGEKICECTMVKSEVCPSVEYFASQVKLGINGVEEICEIPKLSDYEQDLLNSAVPILKENIEEGINFVHGND